MEEGQPRFVPLHLPQRLVAICSVRWSTCVAVPRLPTELWQCGGAAPRLKPVCFEEGAEVFRLLPLIVELGWSVPLRTAVSASTVLCALTGGVGDPDVKETPTERFLEVCVCVGAHTVAYTRRTYDTTENCVAEASISGWSLL